MNLLSKPLAGESFYSGLNDLVSSFECLMKLFLLNRATGWDYLCAIKTAQYTDLLFR